MSGLTCPQELISRGPLSVPKRTLQIIRASHSLPERERARVQERDVPSRDRSSAEAERLPNPARLRVRFASLRGGLEKLMVINA